MPIDAHRIAPKLWVGSVPTSEACKLFDVIVLCAEEHQPSLLCAVHAGFDDSRSPSVKDVQIAVRAAKSVHAMRKKGKRVLVTCAAGVNRSAFVAAMALMFDGARAREAIALLRSRRRPPCGLRPLSNKAFVSILLKMEQLKRMPWQPTDSTTTP